MQPQRIGTELLRKLGGQMTMRLELHLDDQQFSQLVTKTEFQASIAPLATKAELHKELRTQFYWIVGIMVALQVAPLLKSDKKSAAPIGQTTPAKPEAK
jgi:hypothetical protein